MKKGFCLTSFVVCFAFFTFFGSASASVESDFTKAVNEKLKEVNYYDVGSAQVENSISKEAEVTKVLTPDDPGTEENEEEMETYTANVVVAHVSYKLKRDSIFYIQKHDFYYYDIDNQEFLKLSDFPDDQEIASFFDDYMEAGHKAGITLSSNLLVSLLLLLTVLVAPLLVMMFHNKSIPPPMVRNSSVL
jgi:hypothetical protein